MKDLRQPVPEEIVARLPDVDAMLNAGNDLTGVLQPLEFSKSMLDRWRAGYRREAAVVTLRQRFSAGERRACMVVD